MDKFEQTPRGAINVLHEVIGMITAAMKVSDEDDIKEILSSIESHVDSLLEELKMIGKDNGQGAI